MSNKKKFTPDQALQILVQAIDIAIQRGAFDRKQVVDLNDAISTFSIDDPTPSDPPHDPSQPKP
ncbi:hypothetical protein D3C71_344300 [compost metagenome]